MTTKTNGSFAPISQLAEKFGVSDITVYRTFQSKLVHRKKVEGTWQYNVGEFKAYYNANKDRILEKQKQRAKGMKIKKTAETKAANKKAVASSQGQLSSDLMTVQQAADKFGVNAARLYYYVEHNQLSAVKRKQGKRKVAFVNPADVQAILAGRKGVGKVVSLTADQFAKNVVNDVDKKLGKMKEVTGEMARKINGNGHTTGIMMRLDVDTAAVEFLGKLLPQRPFTLTKDNAASLRSIGRINPDVSKGLNKVAHLLELGNTLVLDQVQ